MPRSLLFVALLGLPACHGPRPAAAGHGPLLYDDRRHEASLREARHDGVAGDSHSRFRRRRAHMAGERRRPGFGEEPSRHRGQHAGAWSQPGSSRRRYAARRHRSDGSPEDRSRAHPWLFDGRIDPRAADGTCPSADYHGGLWRLRRSRARGDGGKACRRTRPAAIRTAQRSCALCVAAGRTRQVG